MNTASIARHAAHSAGWALLQNAFKPLIAILIVIFLARLLEPEAYGLIALAGVAVTLISVLIEQGFNDALVQREALEPGHLHAAFWLALASSCVLMFLLIASAGMFAAVVDQPALGPVLQGLAVLFPLQALAVVPQALLQRAFAFRTLALRTLIGIAAGGAAGI
ncbi:MAG: oligosaccharide flippase family protein, partial [Betaproteobacteria bacterium]|nr:oligosaccharide flippase family protein [Betaproteobacteria bacterium]